MDQVVQWFGRDVLDDREARLRRFWLGEGRVVVTCQTSQSLYRQIWDRTEILARVGPNLQAQGRCPGENLPTFFPDFGTISTAKYWGGRLRELDDGHRFIEPAAQTLEEALALVPRPVDDPAMDAAAGLELYRIACRQLGTDRLWYRTPDFQGTLNTAGLILKQDELLVSMYAEPERTHAFLRRISDFLAAWFDFQVRETAGRVCGNIWPYIWLPSDLGASFTEDLMPLLSAEVYAEFGLPYLRRLAEHFGGVFIHCCGDFGRHAPALARLGPLLRGVEFHYPFTRIEELQDCLPPHTVYVPYLNADRQKDFRDMVEYVDFLLTRAAPHTRWWFVLDESMPDLDRLLARVR